MVNHPELAVADPRRESAGVELGDGCPGSPPPLESSGVSVVNGRVEADLFGSGVFELTHPVP